MKNINKDQRIVNRVLWLFIFALLIRSAFTAAAAEQKFEVLKTKTGTYRNVTVTKKTAEWVFILHSEGMGNLRISDLSADTRRRLGYDGTTTEGDFAASAAGTISGLEEAEEAAATEAATAGPSKFDSFQASLVKLPSKVSGSSIRYILLGIACLAYLFFCRCCHLICQKAHTAPGILIWVPGLQLIPMLRAANMSPVWFLAFLVPVLNLVASIIWSFKIVEERGKAPWVAILLLLPITNIFAFLYLAFSDEAPATMDVESSSSMFVLGAA